EIHETPGGQQDEDALARALLRLGSHLVVLGKFALADKALQRAGALFRKLGNPGGESGALSERAHAASRQGTSDQASSLARQAAKIAADHQLAQAHSVALVNLASYEQLQGRPDSAQRLLEEAQKLKESAGDEHGQTVTLHELAKLAVLRGQLVEAR